MIKIYNSSEIDKSEILSRSGQNDLEKAEKTVREIISDVRARGGVAVKEYTLRFDGCDISDMRVTEKEIDEAFVNVGDYFIDTLKAAAANISEYHLKQKREGFTIKRPDGTVLGQRILPVLRAGVYVPGGTAAYPSTVLMDVIPAVVAGVKE